MNIAQKRAKVAELEKQLERERTELVDIERSARWDRLNALGVLLTPQLIDALAPEHSTARCDSDPQPKRCTRCCLRAALYEGCFDVDADFVFYTTMV